MSRNTRSTWYLLMMASLRMMMASRLKLKRLMMAAMRKTRIMLMESGSGSAAMRPTPVLLCYKAIILLNLIESIERTHEY